MARTPNRAGGGAKTNFNGFRFEGRIDLLQAINLHPEYSIQNGNEVVKDGSIVAYYYEKHSLYREYLAPNGVNYKTILSKKLLPDSALLVGDTVFIIEKKYQAGAGSVDEKLQTCDFKKKQYIKLFAPLNIKVEYYYVLNEWFDKPQYRDVFDYIQSVGCKYFIVELPINELNL